MILDNSVAGLINLNLVNQQMVRGAGCFPINYNDYGAHYLMGSPKDGQSLEDVEKLLLDQIEQVKAGNFEDWILPAVINDFKKKQKEDLESNAKRVELMRDSFLAYVEWQKMDSQIAELEKVSKEDIVVWPTNTMEKIMLWDFVSMLSMISQLLKNQSLIH